MPSLKKILRDFHTAPVASRSLGVESPAKVTNVMSRDDVKKIFAAGLERSQSSH
jgi:hypothetical protein